MKEAGFQDIRLSLESADEDFQGKSGGKAYNQEFEKAIRILHSAGFRQNQIRVYTLMNVPGQDSSKVSQTMDYIFETGGMPMLAYYSPIPGTPDGNSTAHKLNLEEPLYQNNTVYYYLGGFDINTLDELKLKEKSYRKQASFIQSES